MDKNNKLHKISGRQMPAQIRLAAAAIGKDKLGFTPKEIGLHSARCGAAMAMYLSGVLVCTIMLLGRWKMVQQRIFTIHQKTNKRIQQRD
jgi:hypothetical protein